MREEKSKWQGVEEKGEKCRQDHVVESTRCRRERYIKTSCSLTALPLEPSIRLPIRPSSCISRTSTSNPAVVRDVPLGLHSQIVGLEEGGIAGRHTDWHVLGHRRTGYVDGCRSLMSRRTGLKFLECRVQDLHIQLDRVSLEKSNFQCCVIIPCCP
jgi:hypothetical protein